MRCLTKKAQQLSINFLIKFILAIVLFGMGFIFLKMIFSQSINMMEIPQNDIDDRIFALNCDSKQAICVGRNSLEMSPGELYVVDVKLYNNFNDDMDATAEMFLIDNSSDDATRAYPGKITIRPTYLENIFIPAKGNSEFSFAIILGKEAPEGSYAIRIFVDRGPGLEDKVKRINLYIE